MNRHQDNVRRLTFPLLCITLMSALATTPAMTQAAVLSNADVQAQTGRSIDEWAGAWWQWAFDQTFLQGHNVLDDPTGEFGPLGNVGGPVFFAEGSPGVPVNPSYDIPSGQFVLLPVATFLWTIFDFQDGTCADVSCTTHIINDNFIDGLTNLSATLDGLPFMDWASHVVRADAANPLVFDVYVGDCGPGENSTDNYCGLQPAMQGGYWLMLEPLTLGPHLLSFSATSRNLDGFTGEIIDGSIELQADLHLNSVPEPATLWLMGLALLVLPWVRRIRC
jgi:hypothetical protein